MPPERRPSSTAGDIRRRPKWNEAPAVKSAPATDACAHSTATAHYETEPTILVGAYAGGANSDCPPHAPQISREMQSGKETAHIMLPSARQATYPDMGAPLPPKPNARRCR